MLCSWCVFVFFLFKAGRFFSKAVTSDLPEAHEENDEEKEADESREPLTFRVWN